MAHVSKTGPGKKIKYVSQIINMKNSLQVVKGDSTKTGAFKYLG